jgi:uncharacterized membrane protein
LKGAFQADHASKSTGLALACAFASAFGIVASSQSAGAADADKEKCFGVVKAGRERLRGG